MRIFLLLIISFFLFQSQTEMTQNEPEKENVTPVLEEDQQKSVAEKQHEFIETIAFGSCSNQDKKQDMWQFVLQCKPDVWIWLGDMVYGDTENMNVLRKKYLQQKLDPRYQILREKCQIFGIWDDHDFGENDGCKTYPKKKESKAEMLKFLDVPSDAAVNLREGAYQSYEIGSANKKIKVILLDGRYFRDELKKRLNGLARYHPNLEGDMLGEAQWEWLEKELANSDAQVNIIGSGVQVIAEEHGYEKWANFPNARQRLLQLIAKTNPTNPIIISGDRHLAEISKIQLEGMDTPLYDITSSGLTHTVPLKLGKLEPNKHRVGERIQERNFALLKFDWTTEPVTIKTEIRGVENKLYKELNLFPLNQKD